jgi:xanthine dehydrogenase FAD-binding subunit
MQIPLQISFENAEPSEAVRAPQTEAALDGKPLATALAAALDAADAEIHPISDIRASAWYRRELVRNILRRMLEHVGER